MGPIPETTTIDMTKSPPGIPFPDGNPVASPSRGTALKVICGTDVPFKRRIYVPTASEEGRSNRAVVVEGKETVPPPINPPVPVIVKLATFTVPGSGTKLKSTSNRFGLDSAPTVIVVTGFDRLPKIVGPELAMTLTPITSRRFGRGGEARKVVLSTNTP
jgi:hypothetical protein